MCVMLRSFDFDLLITRLIDLICRLWRISKLTKVYLVINFGCLFSILYLLDHFDDKCWFDSLHWFCIWLIVWFIGLSIWLQAFWSSLRQLVFAWLFYLSLLIFVELASAAEIVFWCCAVEFGSFWCNTGWLLRWDWFSL